MAETLMKNGKDVMYWIGCLANAAMLLVFLIDAWMWGFSGWANGIYTYWMSLPHFICIALFLSAIESHVSWKGGSSLHRKCSHLATLVNLPEKRVSANFWCSTASNPHLTLKPCPAVSILGSSSKCGAKSRWSSLPSSGTDLRETLCLSKCYSGYIFKSFTCISQSNEW